MNRFFSLVLLSVLFLINATAQRDFIDKLTINIDTNTYSSEQNLVQIGQKHKLAFYYTDENPVLEIKAEVKPSINNLTLAPSLDYELYDSLIQIGNFYRFKVRLRNITKSDLVRFTFLISHDSTTTYQEVHLQPLYKTQASLLSLDNELFIGEEKTFVIETNNMNNIVANNEWINKKSISYKISKENDIIYLHVIAQETGNQLLDIELKLRKPFVDSGGVLHYKLSTLKQLYKVKTSRLQYLAIDQNEITFNEQNQRDGIEIQLESNRFLQLNKTYRIEAQEESGGTLIAELFTKKYLSNNKILCLFRPYNIHRKSTGYLYIKDGDVSKFITNVRITPATKINRISILHEGKEWKASATVYPGQTLDIKIEGEALHKADFYFEDLINLSGDSTIKNENQHIFKLKVPIDITKKRLNIYNHSNPSGHYLTVKEYQQPRPFDYMYLDYGDINRRVSGLTEPIRYEGVVSDLILKFNTDKIDYNGYYYGKQYIDLDIRITGRKNELVELKTIENIAVCPSSNSPRYNYYVRKDCFDGNLSLNKYIRRPTYDLEEWSRISVNISNSDNKYTADGYEKEVELILKRRYSFDIDVSFPAGLITISKRDSVNDGLGNLSGISMAMIAQFSFYHPDKINKYRPFKIGAGFLALNAFNFSDNSNGDLGLVVLGSLYPTTRNAKLSFPLYIGGGYFLKEQKPFFLIGPGIRLKL